MRLPWLLAVVVLLAIVLLSLFRLDAVTRRDRAELSSAREEAAAFRHGYYKEQALRVDIDRERVSTATTLQKLATHVSQQAAQEIEQHKLMAELQKKLQATEGDVSAERGIVTVHLSDEILFASGEAELSRGGQAVLARLGGVLQPLTNKQIVVGGHTDDRPIHTTRFRSNWELSTARAVNVVHYLIDQVGVDPRKLTAAGYSQYHPRSADRAQNRRIEILLVPALVSASPPPGGPAPAKVAAPLPGAPAAAAPPSAGAPSTPAKATAPTPAAPPSAGAPSTPGRVTAPTPAASPAPPKGQR